MQKHTNLLPLLAFIILPLPQIITHYHGPYSRDFYQLPADAGRIEEVVLCVANFFQKGVICHITLKSSHMLINNGKGYTYEVKFHNGGRTLKRRFTAYRLGNMHSKSECYQVTDPKGQYLVVKIPPQPITDIDTYLNAVSHERKLAEKLFELGIKVVVPCLSSVMKHLHKLESAKKMTPSQLEEAYSKILRVADNKYIDQFKIREKFVFFMEFLDEPFLGKVVREFYNNDLLATLKREYFERDLFLLENHDRIGFMSDYRHIGTMKSLYELYSGLQETFKDFCAKVDSILSLYEIPAGIGKKKEWFVASCLGKFIDESTFGEHWDAEYGDKGLIVTRLNTLLNQTIEGSVSLHHYLGVLDREVLWTAFKHSAGKMRMIGNKLLVLLVMLEKMGLVLRDLKVDNLFIADDENMELGVIDLETGGYIGSGRIEGIVPAGMPSNMTISNLLFVSQIKRIYGDENVASILHLQDWYATISMMFETNTGALLFDDPRNYIVKINRQIDERLDANYRTFVRDNPGVKVTPEMIEDFFSLSDEEIKGHSWQFWNLAKLNLEQKRGEYSTKLQEIQYTLPPELKTKFMSDIEEEQRHIQECYHRYKLTAASIEYLNQPTTSSTVLKNNLAIKEQLFAVKKNHQSTKDKTKIKLAKEIDIYRACVMQKEKEEALLKRLALLDEDCISAFDLFPIMLDFITKVMSKDAWFQYSPEADDLSKGRQYKNEEPSIPAGNWKSTIIPSREELLQRSR